MMKSLETKRLLLRKFIYDDFLAIHSYASVPENITYMIWGPNTEEQTKLFINMAIENAEKEPCTNFQYAVVLKDTGKLIGGCDLAISGDEAEIGWILNKDYWKQGLGTEMGDAMLEFGFSNMNIRRIIAHCDSENYGSYRIMEKIGMRREGLFIEGRHAHKLSNKKYGDELSYAILKDEWETRKEIDYYNSLPVEFNDFIDVPQLSDNEIFLVCVDKKPAIPEKKYVPAYEFIICRNGEKIGVIDLRIGYKGFGPDSSSLYYGGQIGYTVDEPFRGCGYAVRACHLLVPIIKAHGMKKVLITNNYTNTASKRVCEKLGAKLIRVARLPEWHEIYKDGRRFSNIFEWSVEW